MTTKSSKSSERVDRFLGLMNSSYELSALVANARTQVVVTTDYGGN